MYLLHVEGLKGTNDFFTASLGGISGERAIAYSSFLTETKGFHPAP
jgi:hypothetical protein